MPTREIVDYLREAVGDGLRAVDYYGRDGHETLYIRDDVAALYSDEDFDRLRRQRILDTYSARHSRSIYELGDFHYSVQQFEDALLLQFPITRDSGVVVSLDAGVSIEIPGFGYACLERVRADPPTEP